MRYVVAGYVFVLSVLALYAVQLMWRRRRLSRAVARVAGAAVPATATTADATATGGPTAPATPGDIVPVETT